MIEDSDIAVTDANLTTDDNHSGKAGMPQQCAINDNVVDLKIGLDNQMDG